MVKKSIKKIKKTSQKNISLKSNVKDMQKKEKVQFNQDTQTNTSKKSSKKIFKLIISSAIVILIYFLVRNYLIVAIVGNKPITRFEMITELEKTSGKQVLENIVIKNLIIKEANKRNIIVSDDTINKEIQAIKDNLTQNNAVLEDVMKSENITMNQLKDNIVLQKYTQELLKDSITVTDQEISDYFDQNKDFFEAGSKLEDLSADIKNQIQQEKYQEEFTKLIEQLKTQYDIKYFITY